MNDRLKKKLAEGEIITAQAKTTVSGLVVTWLSIPGFYLISWCIVYLPGLLQMLFSSAVRSAVAEELGVSDFGELGRSDLFAYIEEGFGPVLSVVFGFAKVMLTLLALVWLVWCIVMTVRHFRYALVVTNRRVLGFAAGKEMDAPLEEIVNVYLEQSLWGKLLRYGSIVVHARKCSLTFRNIHRPQELKNLLMSYAEKY